MHKTTQFKIVRTYRAFIKENCHEDKMTLNLKISSNDDIYCKVKKFGMAVHQVHLKRKSYHSSDVYKFSHMDYDDMIKFLCDEDAKINLKIGDFEVFIDNKEKIVKTEKFTYGQHGPEVLST